MNSFLKHILPKFAKSNPQIEVVISPRPRKHPIVRGVYSNTPLPPLSPRSWLTRPVNGREKVVCVRKMDHLQVSQHVEALRNSDGKVLKKRKKAVESVNAGVRGVWSPFHAGKEGAWRV